MGYICERCGKYVDDENSYWSGRFCSRSCANTRKHSNETKDKIRNSINKATLCFCVYCGIEFSNFTAKMSHERLCPCNHDKLENPSTQLQNKLKRFVTLYKSKNGLNTNTKLDITYEELEKYRQDHLVCEICGRPVEETVKYSGKFAAKHLCIDHDHKTNKFRGLLCKVCNRQLGWYENNKTKIKQYLCE